MEIVRIYEMSDYEILDFMAIHVEMFACNKITKAGFYVKRTEGQRNTFALNSNFNKELEAGGYFYTDYVLTTDY